MKKEERIGKILEMLRHENGLPVRLIAGRLQVSHMTVRRDLEEMASRDMVRQFHGSVILKAGFEGERGQSPYSLHSAGAWRAEEKRRIGLRAAGLIRDGDVLVIDSGSTTEWLARSLPADMDLTILSYALNVISETARLPGVRSLFAGGVLHENLLMFESGEGLEFIRRFRATRAFISAAGITHDFGVIRSDYFADLRDFDMIVTDGELPDGYRRILSDLGIDLVLA